MERSAIRGRGINAALAPGFAPLTGLRLRRRLHPEWLTPIRYVGYPDSLTSTEPSCKIQISRLEVEPVQNLQTKPGSA